MGWGHVRRSVGESSSDEASTSSTEVPRRFAVAAQPEIMRAAEKDDQYASFLYEASQIGRAHV